MEFNYDKSGNIAFTSYNIKFSKSDIDEDIPFSLLSIKFSTYFNFEGGKNCLKLL